jgi:hypothetical protein
MPGGIPIARFTVDIKVQAIFYEQRGLSWQTTIEVFAETGELSS